MTTAIIFLGLIAAIHGQPASYQYYKYQQPIDGYYPEELEALDRESRSVQDYEPIVPETDYYRERRSIYENDEPNVDQQQPALTLYYYPEEVEETEALGRHRRSLQPGAPTFPMPNQDPPTKLTPHVTKQDGTTNVGAKVEHKFGNHDASAHWNKNIRGPGRSKPNWGVRGTFRF